MSSRKFNQYLSKKLSEFKSDDVKIISLCNFLKEKLPEYQIEREPFLLFEKKFWKLIKVTRNIEEHELKNCFFHSPDIVVMQGEQVKLVIEIDGSIHDKKTHKTWMRNRNYENACIPLLVVNERDLKYLKISIEDFILEELVKRKLL